MTDLPPGWAITTIGEIAETSLGKMLDRGKHTGKHQVPYLRNINVQWGYIDTRDILYMDIPLEQQDFYRLRAGDLLVCEGGEIGRSAIWLGSNEYMAFQKALHRLRASRGVEVKYIQYYMQYLHYGGELAAYATGSTIRHIPQARLRQVKIRLPPSAEQRRIVAALDDLLSHLDAATEDIWASNERLTKWRLTTLRAAMAGRLGGSSSKWGRATIGELAHVGTGATPLRSRRDYYEGGTIPWVTSALLNRPSIESTDQYITEKALRETSAKLWEPGTILVAMYGEGKTRGKSSELRIPAATNQACAAIVLRKEHRQRGRWIRLVLDATYEQNRRLASGGVQPNLSLGLVRKIEVPLPPTDVEIHILNEVERLTSVGERLATQLAVAGRRSNVLRTALLAQAFAGRLVPQYREDEPASAVLERIQQQRAAQPKARRRRRPTSLPQEEALL